MINFGEESHAKILRDTCKSMSWCRVLPKLFLVVPLQSPCSLWPSIFTLDPDRWLNCRQLLHSARRAMPQTLFFSLPNVVVYQQRLPKTISLSFNECSPIGYNPPFVCAQEELWYFHLSNSFPNSSGQIWLGSSLSIIPSSTCNKTNLFLTASKYQTPSSLKHIHHFDMDVYL